MDTLTPLNEKIEAACAQACEAIAPAWPLDRAIAVNPHWSRIGMPVRQVAARMAVLGGMDVFPTRDAQQQAWDSGRIGAADLDYALAKLSGSAATALTPAQCLAAAQQAARPYLRAARIPVAPDRPGPDLLKFAEDYATAQALLLDAEVDGYGGGGKTFTWSRLPTNVNAHLVLGGGLTPANVTDGIVQLRSRLRPGKTLAVDVSSGVELSKGIKDPEKMWQFVAAVRAADALA